MSPYELIKAKRDGQTLSETDIHTFIQSYTKGHIPGYQMAAMCMAIFFRGLTNDELLAWTKAMLVSGEVLDLFDIPGIKVDKHSTGGVGDKVSLALAPLVAACAVPVPMVSGRSLGHTGGTLDKLESIPGFRVNLSPADYRRQMREVGACLIGQTEFIAPADKKLYALRDLTATVDCMPLIASSIMSKKLAEGIDALVLDVKVGTGALLKTIEDARTLGRMMVDIGASMGKPVMALLTDMQQPLGHNVGNALEVIEAVQFLQGQAPADFTAITFELAQEMLMLGGRAKTAPEARTVLEDAIVSGAAKTKLRALVEAQGGDAAFIDDLSKLPQAQSTASVRASSHGFVTHIDGEAIGLAAVTLGAGRRRVNDAINHAVGFSLEKKIGDEVAPGDVLVTVHYDDASCLNEVCVRILRAYVLGETAIPKQPLILERLTSSSAIGSKLSME